MNEPIENVGNPAAPQDDSDERTGDTPVGEKQSDTQIDTASGNSTPSRYPHPYSEIDGCLHLELDGKKGIYKKKLCNFIPYMTGEMRLDDGVEQKHYYMIEGILQDGTYLLEVNIPASEFNTLGWIAQKWGARCNIEIGQSTKELIRHAIQCTAPNIDTKTIYSHLGWTLINNHWSYLMPGGQYDIRMGGKLRNYRLIDEIADSSSYALLRILDSCVAPPEIIFPMLSMVYLSPLNEFLKQAGYEPKVTLALIAKTGSRKSTLAALFLSHFGNFNNTDLPMSFRDTPNSIIQNAFILKDVLTVVDDFHPATRYEEQEMNKIAQTIARAYGDRVGRSRLKSDSSPMENKPPRGNCIITCEQMPDINEGGLARFLRLDFSPQDINLDVLTNLQQLASRGVYRSAMAGYIQWLSSMLTNPQAFVDRLGRSFIALRDSFAQDLGRKGQSFHGRLPESAAWLQTGLCYCLAWAVETKVMSEVNAKAVYQRGMEAMTKVIVEQLKQLSTERPAEKFVRKLIALLDSGTVFVQYLKYSQAQLTGNGFIGYEDEDYYFLIPETAHSKVKRLCDEQGESFPTTLKALLKQLKEDGYIETAEDQNTRVLKVAGRCIRTIWLRKTCVSKNNV